MPQNDYSANLILSTHALPFLLGKSMRHHIASMLPLVLCVLPCFISILSTAIATSTLDCGEKLMTVYYR